MSLVVHVNRLKENEPSDKEYEFLNDPVLRSAVLQDFTTNYTAELAEAFYSSVYYKVVFHETAQIYGVEIEAQREGVLTAPQCRIIRLQKSKE